MALPSIVRVLESLENLVGLDTLLAESTPIEQLRGLVEVRDWKKRLHASFTLWVVGA